MMSVSLMGIGWGWLHGPENRVTWAGMRGYMVREIL